MHLSCAFSPIRNPHFQRTPPSGLLHPRAQHPSALLILRPSPRQLGQPVHPRVCWNYSNQFILSLLTLTYLAFPHDIHFCLYILPYPIKTKLRVYFKTVSQGRKWISRCLRCLLASAIWNGEEWPMIALHCHKVVSFVTQSSETLPLPLIKTGLEVSISSLLLIDFPRRVMSSGDLSIR